jgi:hypothetical protein
MKAPRQEPSFEGDRGAARLGELARKLDVDYPAPPPTSPADYAQPAHRTPPAEPHSFLELPMKELEETRKAAKEEMAALDQEANELYEMFEGRVASIKAKYERLRKGIGLSMDAFKVLREQCVALDDPPPAEQ